MDINKINDLVSNILKFSKLLQNINVDTINILRELKGSEVLVNYENMIEIEPLDTIKGIRNFIINEINSLFEIFPISVSFPAPPSRFSTFTICILPAAPPS